jgi:hypothetical protein
VTDCLKEARAIAARLRAEGKSPWIGRLRRVEQIGEERFHHPLIPRVPNVLAFTTHYVCCCDGFAHDPLLGRPEPLETYTQTLFGIDWPLEAIGTA